jgi:hypothetical protein
MAHLPLFKLGVLLVKQATKPMARAIKARSQASDSLSKFCEYVGQTWHVQTTKLNLYVQGHKVKGVKPLNEAEAVQSGAELIADGFVLSIGIAALILESRRSAKSAAEKAVQKAERRQQKMEAMQHLNDTIRDLAKYSIDMRKAIADYDKQRIEFEKAQRRSSAPNIILPSIPASIAELVGGHSDTPTEIAVAAHNKTLEQPKDDWKRSVFERLGLESATNAIKYIGSVVNGEEVGDDIDVGSDED